MKNIEKSYKIISSGLIQRENILQEIKNAKRNCQNLSDFGWFLTLGSETLGMLSAVTAGKQARAYNDIISTLENEIEILRNTKIELKIKLGNYNS